MLSMLARRMFHSKIRDIYCGMRGFMRASFDRLELRCTGVEFAAEMIIKACLLGERIAHVPITLSPDVRRSRRPHLRTFRDGWRTVRFFLVFSDYASTMRVVVPGATLLTAGSSVMLNSFLRSMLGLDRR